MTPAAFSPGELYWLFFTEPSVVKNLKAIGVLLLLRFQFCYDTGKGSDSIHLLVFFK